MNDFLDVKLVDGKESEVKSVSSYRELIQVLEDRGELP